jgi:hypothetical protein
MVEFGKIPGFLYAYLKEQGEEKIYMALYCDMNCEHTYCDGYVVLAEKYIYVIHGSQVLLPKEKMGKGLDSSFSCDEFRKYALDEIDNIKVEELLSTGRLIAKTTENDYINLSSFTNACLARTGSASGYSLPSNMRFLTFAA